MLVALGSGAGVYFALLREPQSWVALAGVAAVGTLLLAAMRWSGSRALTAALVLSACALAGFSLAMLRSDNVKAPIAPAQSHPERLEDKEENTNNNRGPPC